MAKISAMALVINIAMMSTITLSGCSNFPDKAFLIDPARSVGYITPSCNEEDLIKSYGLENVHRQTIVVGEGEEFPGTVLFPDSADKVEITWKDSYRNPNYIMINGDNSRWHSAEGIKIGTPMEKVEQANGRAFELAGFAWDCEGISTSWCGGRLPENLKLQMNPTQQLDKEQKDQLLGDYIFISTHPLMQKSRCVVACIYVYWNQPPGQTKDRACCD